jgi:hypothetical protein
VSRMSEGLAFDPLPIVLWHESEGDLLIFCYLIVLGIVMARSSRTMASIPGRQNFKFAVVKDHPECSTPSSISSTLSTIPKD